jgi:hypothetical protein
MGIIRGDGFPGFFASPCETMSSATYGARNGFSRPTRPIPRPAQQRSLQCSADLFCALAQFAKSRAFFIPMTAYTTKF